MKSTPGEIEKVLAQLEETPVYLSKLILNRPAEGLATSMDQRNWSAQEILAHLRACADLWTYSIYAMLTENEPVLPDINERKYARAAHYGEMPFRMAVEAFSLQRMNLMRVLGELPPEGWERGAIIFERRHTVFTQARRMAKHEAEHCEQLQALNPEK